MQYHLNKVFVIIFSEHQVDYMNDIAVTTEPENNIVAQSVYVTVTLASVFNKQ